MDDSEATSLEQVRAFLAGSGEVRFTGQKRHDVYRWTGADGWKAFPEYAGLGRRDKGFGASRYLANTDDGLPARASGAGDAVDRRVYRERARQGKVVSAQEIRCPLHQRRCAFAGPCRSKSWKSEWSRRPDGFCSANTASTVRQASSTAHCRRSRWRRFTGSAIPEDLPETWQYDLPADAPHADTDRRAAQTEAGRTSGISAHRHRASGRSGRQQRGISHQRRGRSNTVGDLWPPHRRYRSAG